MQRDIESRLIEAFRGRAYFTREELLAFFRSVDPELKEGTFGWRIHDLKNRNIIKTFKRGLYVISQKPDYEPDLSPELLKIARQLVGKFDEIRHCIWETAWLNEFTRHQISKSMLIIEVEKGFEEPVFYHLKDAGRRDVFLNPDEKDMDLYVTASAQPIIIKRLLTRAPLMKRTEKKVQFCLPALEKILVDLYAEEKLFRYLQGPEMVNIYENAISGYAINFTRLLGYARRREREEEIRGFMEGEMGYLVPVANFLTPLHAFHARF